VEEWGREVWMVCHKNKVFFACAGSEVVFVALLSIIDVIAICGVGYLYFLK